ncbi:MAG: hypothetical protein GY724_11935 [Actinomycetia bacterium]|nr:hypothetical protein [Actinomycetes bacterium]MCP4228116.1 hypothetical protein [Actinomycetes bacterium]MCP5030465.1 hypothetical protein [Actinomycetes bacterium]
MSGPRSRLTRVADLATEAEERTRTRWIEATQAVRAADHNRQGVLVRATELAEQTMPMKLRALLVSTGARHLHTLSDDKTDLLVEAEAARADLEAAMIRTRSLERVVARHEAAERTSQQRIDAADWHDLVAARSARIERS